MRAVLLLLSAVVLMGACSSTTPVNTWVSADCHAAATPFSTYAITLEQVPGFKEPIMREALAVALQRHGLTPVAPGRSADVTMHLRVSLIRRGGAFDDAEPVGAPPEPWVEDDASMAPASASSGEFGGGLATDAVSRFTAHADLELIDERDGRLVWKGAMDRAHAISGGETFHDARARALIVEALDSALAGLDRPCD